MLYKTLDVVEGNSFGSKELHTNDIIFNSSLNPSDQLRSIVNDTDYSSPDIGKYIFSTMSGTLSCIHSNNMMTPIRKKMSINNYVTYRQVANSLGVDKIQNGVYIIEYINIHALGRDGSERVLEYYLNCNNVTYDERVINQIRQELTIGNNARTNTFSHKKLRVITFVPENVIIDKHYVYVENSDVVIAFGNVDSTVCHPNSRTFKDSMNDKVYKDGGDNSINISIINNEDLSKPYYVKVGNDIHKIYPKKDVSKKNGVTIDTIRNGAKVNEKNSSLKDCENLGVYTSRDACDTNGDVRLTLEKEKLELDKEKISKEYELTLKRHEHELGLMAIKFSTAELDSVKKERDYDLDLNSKIMDLKIKKFNALLDYKSKVDKHNFEAAKYEMDINKIQVDNGLKLLSGVVGIGKALIK